jgi:hypothetical protein
MLSKRPIQTRLLPASLGVIFIVWFNVDDIWQHFSSFLICILVGLSGLLACHLKGWFKSFSGIFSMGLFFQLFVFPQVYLVMAGLSLDSYIDSRENIQLIYLVAMLGNLFAVLMMSDVDRQNKNLVTSHFFEKQLNKRMKTSSILLLMMVAIFLRHTGIMPIPIDATLMSCILYATIRNVKTGHSSRNLIWLIGLVYVGTIWWNEGLSGMKSSILGPVFFIAMCLVAFEFKVRTHEMIVFALMFVVMSIVASSLQGMRNFRDGRKEVRLVMASSMLEGYLKRSFDIAVPIPGSETRLVEGFSSKALKGEGDEVLVLKRASALASDLTFIEAFYRKGGLDESYFFESFRFIPKSVENVESGDFTSAYFGRYAEIWSQSDFISGLTITGPVVWFAYWGWVGLIFNFFLLNLFVQLIGSALFPTRSILCRILFSVSVFDLSQDSGQTIIKYLYRLFPLTLVQVFASAAIVWLIHYVWERSPRFGIERNSKVSRGTRGAPLSL